ncbi:MAG: DUF3769 domain-containing protein [Cyanobacteria bacterium P01_D01_bin.105]
MVYFDLPPMPPAIEPPVIEQSAIEHADRAQAFSEQIFSAQATRQPSVHPLVLTQLNELDREDEGLPVFETDIEPPDTELPDAQLPDAQLPDAELPDAEPSSNPAPDDSAPDGMANPSSTDPDSSNAAEDSAAFISELRLTSDFQEYDPETQIITARGNVLLQLNDAIIEADELWLNLINRYALADGDVLLTRGAQIVRGDRAEYNFIQQAGVVRNAAGTLFFPDVADDLRSPLDPRLQSVPTATRRAYDPLGSSGETPRGVNSDGSVVISSEPGATPLGSNSAGSLKQLRFETDELIFDVEGWRAEAVRITNDPFSPPELELRTARLVLRNISPTQDELLLQRPRLVFDQGLSLPLGRRRILLSRGTLEPEDLNPVPASFGIDGRDRGGFFLGRKIPLVRNGNTRLSVTPQFLLARAFSEETSSPLDLNSFGVTTEVSSQLGDRTTLEGSAELNGLQPSEFTENLRTTVGISRSLGNHRLNLQYSYRERLFNGTLGFQDVQSSLGAVIISPDYQLGKNGPSLSYQASSQLINADSDQADLVSAETGRATLGRFQASASLRKNFNLWRGQPKPTTQDEGLRFTPTPVIPFLDLTSGLRATGTYYTNGDLQDNLVAEVGLEGQLGHLSRNFGDYTRFRVGYSQSFIGGADSPFLFDREIDRNILSLGITQQVYGPILAGFQTALSLNENRAINNIYSLEYSRRTYGILIRYDSVQSTGSIGFRLSNFSWIGDTDPFDSPRFRRVEGGVIESR